MSVLSDGIYAFMSTTLSVGTEVYPSRLGQGATLKRGLAVVGDVVDRPLPRENLQQQP